jgi:hypothetical protein
LDYFEMNFVFEEPHPQTKPKVRPWNIVSLQKWQEKKIKFDMFDNLHKNLTNTKQNPFK